MLETARKKTVMRQRRRCSQMVAFFIFCRPHVHWTEDKFFRTELKETCIKLVAGSLMDGTGLGLSPQWDLGNRLVGAHWDCLTRPWLSLRHHLHRRGSAVEAKFSERLASLSEGDISVIIQMAWEDRTAFETIQERMGWSEADVIRLMRHELQPNSFRMWRKRMKGRTTKHRALRSPEMQFNDRLIADHRRGNC